ncbi:MAG: type VI secretion system VgrG family protein [Planctomycetota bacterium]
MTFTKQEFLFRSRALAHEELLVRELRGVESMSRPFRFELDLHSVHHEIDLEAALYAPAQIGIKVPVPGDEGGSTTLWISGRLDSFELSKTDTNMSVYRAVLVPTLQNLQESHRSRIFVEETAPTIVAKLLEEGGLLNERDFYFSESMQQALGVAEPTERARYPQREYVVQYGENDLMFVHRWLEHEGVFYWFENQEEWEEKLKFGDSNGSFVPLPIVSSFPYRPVSTSETGGQDYQMAVSALKCSVQRLPNNVVLQDYNWRQPSNLRVEESVRDDSGGVQYEYNDHYKSLAQGKELARIRAEELACRAKTIHGESDARNMRPGFTMQLAGHPRDDLNGELLIVEVVHTASQEISFDRQAVTSVSYKNSFVATPMDRPYRPACVTPWPSIKGVINARIDGTSDGTYADMDKYGRYKVRVPFDVFGDDKSEGLASRWIRMVQPYVGEQSGMNFALRKGTEVLLTHIDGDPDRPLISGAVHDGLKPALVDGGNSSQSRIVTASGNELTFEDQDGKQGVTMIAGNGATYSCSTKPGSMGKNSAGAASSGGGGGAVRRPAEPATPASATAASGKAGDLPGGGIGTVYTEEQIDSFTEQKDTGATGFFLLEGFTQLSPPRATATIEAAFSEIYRDPEKEVTATNAFEKLNEKCSSFEAAIGKYELIVGGPHMEAKFGNVGEYLNGSRITAIHICKDHLGTTNAKESGEGSYEETVGVDTQFKSYKGQVNANSIEEILGPSYGGWKDLGPAALTTFGSGAAELAELAGAPDAPSDNWPTEIKTSARGCLVQDELFAKYLVLRLQGAPFILDINVAYMTVNLNIGGPVFDIFGPFPNFEIAVKTFEAHMFKSKVKLADLDATLTATQTWVNNNQAGVAANTAWVNNNEAVVASNALGVAANKTQIAANEANITKNKTNVTKNGFAITSTNVRIKENSACVAEHLVSLLHTQQALLEKHGLP